MYCAALTEGGFALSAWQHVRRHYLRRCTTICRATVNGAAKKS
jgi:hypothetical protein